MRRVKTSLEKILIVLEITSSARELTIKEGGHLITKLVIALAESEHTTLGLDYL